MNMKDIKPNLEVLPKLLGRTATTVIVDEFDVVPVIKRNLDYWDDAVPFILNMIRTGYRLKDIAEAYQSSVPNITSVLSSRGIRLGEVRHSHRHGLTYTYKGNKRCQKLESKERLRISQTAK